MHKNIERMTFQDICREIAKTVDSHGKRVYDERETRAVTRVLLEDVLGFTLADIYGGKQVKILEESAENCPEGIPKASRRNAEGSLNEKIDDFTRALNLVKRGVPVQYAVGRALFADRYFKVSKGVLIPRPETEELCQWIADDCKTAEKILDIGTGSGCIAVTLSLDTGASVTAWDIADEALVVAEENARTLGAEVVVERNDILTAVDDGRRWDVVVSNPPYICEKEKAAMEANVLDYEPGLALFVPDSDPLLFYRAIARYSAFALKEGGSLFFEVNPAYIDEMKSMLQGEGFSRIEVRKDLYGRERMMKIWKE